ncbi:hypothetical protein BH23ACT12_BH23ACT12_23760 [soil metagenome]
MKRRDFIKGSVVAVPGSVALQMLGTRFAFAQSADFASDIDVLNYALTLEYLEAEFYRQGNAANLLSGKEATYAGQIGADEAAHVSSITQTIQKLGGSPVASPAVDFADSFSNRENYLKTAHVFENLGVQAYLGAAGFITDKQILQAAAGIFGVEARHAAIIGNMLELTPEGGVYMGPNETPKSKAQVLAAAAPFIKGSPAAAGSAAATL